MKNKFQNFFFLFGITIFAIMVYNLGFTVIVNNIRHAGHWFWLILALWLVLYLGNTLSWYLIIKAGKPKDKVEKVKFLLALQGHYFLPFRLIMPLQEA